MENPFLRAMQYRHACKLFNDSKPIKAEDFEFILEAGRLSPSSFGMEHWHFYIIRKPALREELKAAAWNQNQISSASEVIVITAKKSAFKAESDYPEKMLSRKIKDSEKLSAYMERFNNFMADKTSDFDIICWSFRQCYLAAANMMTAAAYIGIDSCPLEGFIKREVEQLLKIDTHKEEVALILTFGYRQNDQPESHRLAGHEIVTYM